MTGEGDLPEGELRLTGRIMSASNATFQGEIGGRTVVYKPIDGERPLWDFPDRSLAAREVAAYVVSEELGWAIVPRTWLRDGPLGRGMVQLWQDVDPDQDPVDIVAAEAVPDVGWRRVFDGTDDDDRAVALIHEDSAALRRMAVFDALVNNADRKGGHILPLPDGRRRGVDHGLTFHPEPKLRTVLWGWIGEELEEAELAGVARVRAALEPGAGRGSDAALGPALAALLEDREVRALAARCDELLAARRFPAPRGDMPAVPWPLF